MKSRKLTKLEIFLIIIVFALLAIIYSFSIHPSNTVNQPTSISEEDKYSQKVNTYYGEGDSMDEIEKNAVPID